MAVVDFEVLFDDRPFSFARPVGRREQVFRVNLVMDPLVAGEADAGQQNRNDHEVARITADNQA